ncbi:MAG: hypothetical protein OXB86_00905 [Bdellovibrionales bacterium]|nr:hypothetical protein [Bdellovibrionales bacterium]
MKRRQKTSIFICCEGKTEVAFLKYIKSLYIAGEQKSIRIKSANGGDILSMKRHTGEQKNHIHIDKDYILLDGDQIKSKNINEENVLVVQPCIEGLFLEILDRSKPRTSRKCKKIFEKNYLNSKDKLHHKSYQTIFNKNKLENARSRLPLLNKILKIFETEQ